MEENSNLMNVVIENGRPMLICIYPNSTDRCMIYRAKTDEPYIRRYGFKFYLEKEQVEQLHALIL